MVKRNEGHFMNSLIKVQMGDGLYLYRCPDCGFERPHTAVKERDLGPPPLHACPKADAEPRFDMAEILKMNNDRVRVPEGTLCDYCKNPESPLTDANSRHLFQHNSKGEEITCANVHRECADAWAANSGTITNDDPLPRRA